MNPWLMTVWFCNYVDKLGQSTPLVRAAWRGNVDLIYNLLNVVILWLIELLAGGWYQFHCKGKTLTTPNSCKKGQSWSCWFLVAKGSKCRCRDRWRYHSWRIFL
jgi:hypothetical protein